MKQLHGDIGHIVVFSDIINRNDVGVRELACRFGFAEKLVFNLGQLLGFDIGIIKGFDGHFTIDARVITQKNGAHGAMAQLLDNFITSESRFSS